ncbi:hypothetical protein NDU88_000211 [Pleurodeles waltl]|uniref:Uncharacterized protein n=1 Tax=Pleurodeles waltl TaxID=8319 RepID=A0AAV7L5R6_PLEWA|nr:hypothetical protein NDU88_000211 [Pleurodeles waltl]
MDGPLRRLDSGPGATVHAALILTPPPMVLYIPSIALARPCLGTQMQLRGTAWGDTDTAPWSCLREHRYSSVALPGGHRYSSMVLPAGTQIQLRGTAWGDTDRAPWHCLREHRYSSVALPGGTQIQLRGLALSGKTQI